jgi:hypothetical protein
MFQQQQRIGDAILGAGSDQFLLHVPGSAVVYTAQVHDIQLALKVTLQFRLPRRSDCPQYNTFGLYIQSFLRL